MSRFTSSRFTWFTLTVQEVYWTLTVQEDHAHSAHNPMSPQVDGSPEPTEPLHPALYLDVHSAVQCMVDMDIHSTARLHMAL